MAYIYLVLAFTLNATANILLKSGSEVGLKFTNYYLVGGIALFAINIIFYFLALKNLALSTAYPIMIVMSFLIINAYAYFGFSEKINIFQILGYILIILGLITVIKFNENL